MKKSVCIALVFLFFITPAINSAGPQDVISWTEQTLSNTLALDYNNIDQQLEAVKSHYTVNAWEALGTFFNQGVSTIRSQKLVLHPEALAPAQIEAEGDYSGIHYWRINQDYYIPEVNMTVRFSAIVIRATNPPYIIQSLDMTKKM
ncbi:DotI/IcmL/TraM family protein [Legionella dresdenensis]|uniref:DotI/IcmL/TraM family protein n=1 Tax=Legionella dresdenensis TaxID=450200 RepID=A0ABV8CFB6_9GAMM